MSSSYCIRSSYKCRAAPDYYADTPDIHADGVVWQPQVYAAAAAAARLLGCDTIIDIGCGSASKLIALHPEFKLVGVDFGGNLDFCRARFSDATWLEADFETCRSLDLPDATVAKSIIVCADVIEHLVDPTALLDLIRNLLRHSPLTLLSTPERHLLGGLQDSGPPRNPHHVREWSLSELRRLAIQSGFTLAYAGLTQTNTEYPDRNTILLGLSGREAGAGEITAKTVSAGIFPPPVATLEYWKRALVNSAIAWRKAQARQRA